MKLLMYGAGSIGRGFIGPLFSQSGFEVVFVDVNVETVSLLNEERGYPVSIMASEPYDQIIRNVRAVDGRSEEAVIREIAECDIMATSLGAAVLEQVSPIIAKGFAQRHRQSGRPLNILICENLKDSSKLLRGWLKSALPLDLHDALDKNAGLIETAIGRMVPVMTREMQKGNALRVCVEEYGFLPVDQAAFIGAIPEVKGLIPYSPFAFYEERKLYLHNMGHVICAYLGLMRGYEYIYEAISDISIRLAVQSAMTESAAMLSQSYGVPFHSIYVHAEDLILRFGNRLLVDTCERVARDPMRKLGAHDRLAGPLKKCREMRIFPAFISLGLAATLLNVTSERSEAESVLRDVCRINGEEAAVVMEIFDYIQANTSMEQAVQYVAELKRSLYGQVV